MKSKKSPLYTRRGDKGMTSLVGEIRVSKTHPRIESYGTIDELSSFIGLLITELSAQETIDLLQYVQHKLFSIGSYLATDPEQTDFVIESRIFPETINRLEEMIDLLDGRIPPMKAFILPGGCRSAAQAHICRTVCRRAERDIYRLAEVAEVESPVLTFINRLSDLLFIIARNECINNKQAEIIWDNACI